MNFVMSIGGAFMWIVVGILFLFFAGKPDLMDSVRHYVDSKVECGK